MSKRVGLMVLTMTMAACTLDAAPQAVELPDAPECPDAGPVDAPEPDAAADAQEPEPAPVADAGTDAAAEPDDDGVDASWCLHGADMRRRLDLLDDGMAVLLVSGNVSGAYVAGEWQRRDNGTTVVALYTGEAMRFDAAGRAQYTTGEVEQWTACDEEPLFPVPDLYDVGEVAGEWCAGAVRFELRTDRVALRVDGDGSWTGSVAIEAVSGRVTVVATGIDALSESLGERTWTYAYDRVADVLISDSDGVVGRCEP